MAVICWGNLGKTADDNTRIEQSIQDYVQDHNENPNAHQIEGSSLYMHRVNEAIDHMDGSISLKKLLMTKLILIYNFSSLDAWTTAGSITPRLLGTLLVTTNTKNTEAYMTASGGATSAQYDPGKNPFFQTGVSVKLTDNCTAWWGFGSNILGDQDSYAGFKVVNGTLTAVWGRAGNDGSHKITGITLSALNMYRVIVRTDDEEIDFYINGVLKYTSTTHWSNLSSVFLYTYYVKTTTASARYIEVSDLLIEKDR